MIRKKYLYILYIKSKYFNISTITSFFKQHHFKIFSHLKKPKRILGENARCRNEKPFHVTSEKIYSLKVSSARFLRSIFIIYFNLCYKNPFQKILLAAGFVNLYC